MSSNEEYLDSLLKTMIEDEPPRRENPFAAADTKGEEPDPENDKEANSFSADDLAAMLDELEPTADENRTDFGESVYDEIPIAPADFDAPEEESALLQEFGALEEDSALPGEAYGTSDAEETLWEEPGEAPETENTGALHSDTAQEDPNRQMSAEEIEAMFAAMDAESGDTEESAEDSESGENAPDDMLALLESVSGDEESGDAETGASEGEPEDGAFDFFAMDEEEPPSEEAAGEGEQETVIGADLDALIDQASEAAQEEAQAGLEEENQTAKPSTPPKTKAKKEKKPKKEKPEKDKKPGLFSKLLLLLTDDGQDEQELQESIDGYNMDAENQSVLEELGETQLKQPAARKEKAKKEKKPKKPKAEKPKKPKKEKPTKEPKPKEEQPPQKKGRPLPKKRVAAIVALGATLIAASWLFGILIPGIMDQKRAMQAYDKGNYEEAFYLLQGKELKKEEKDTYKKTILILQLERQLESYQNYVRLDMPLEALNALVKGVSKYQKGMDAAAQYGVSDKTKSLYLDILTLLQEEYGLNEEGVQNILTQKDDVYYTVALKRALGKEIATPQDTAEESAEQESTEQMPDMLPEEMYDSDY